MELRDYLKLNALDAYTEYEDALCYLADDMLDYNSRVNLTAIRDTDGVYLRHIVDSLTLAPFISDGASVIDVGCGGGFPSLPLAIVRSDISVTSLDSTQKKLNFISGHAKNVGLTNITTLCARAEEVGRDKKYRESFDCAVARGVCEMRMLCELCLPLVRVGGKFIAMKNGDCADELDAAMSALTTLGGRLTENSTVTLTDGSTEIKHAVIVIQKTVETPNNYPRDWPRITKKPL